MHLNRRYVLKLTASIILCHTLSAFAQDTEKYALQYSFKKGDNLQYKTERHDSSSFSFGGQSQTRKSTTWTLNTLSVLETPTESEYKISIKQDSTWYDEETAAMMESMRSSGSGNVTVRRGSGGGGGGMVMRMGGGGTGDKPIEMTKTGKSATKDPVVSPFILPLPDKPISVNETWDFNLTVKMKGRAKGETNIKGQCLLYEVRKNKNKNVAVIIVNLERLSNTSMKGEQNGTAFSVTTQSSTTGFNLVFFNIDKGVIEEINSEETTERAFEMSGTSNVSSQSTKQTIKLLSL